jgi:hypothetical protein
MSEGYESALAVATGRERVQPAVEEVAGQIEPATKDITEGIIRPGGEALSKNAVPVTERVVRENVEPAVDIVRSSPPFSCSFKWFIMISQNLQCLPLK